MQKNAKKSENEEDDDRGLVWEKVEDFEQFNKDEFEDKFAQKLSAKEKKSAARTASGGGEDEGGDGDHDKEVT